MTNVPSPPPATRGPTQYCGRQNTSLPVSSMSDSTYSAAPHIDSMQEQTWKRSAWPSGLVVLKHEYGRCREQGDYHVDRVCGSLSNNRRGLRRAHVNRGSPSLRWRGCRSGLELMPGANMSRMRQTVRRDGFSVVEWPAPWLRMGNDSSARRLACRGAFSYNLMRNALS